MQKLRIANFSCIKFAEIETADLTILIGPQASGKSVISKLLYFFNGAIADLITFAEDQADFKDYTQSLSQKFYKWFPASAWGPKLFQIRFTAGSFEFVLKRGRTYKTPSERVYVQASEDVQLFYSQLLVSFQTVQAELEQDESRLPNPKSIEVSYRMRSSAERSLFVELGNSYIDYQVFVPAGRSFFTSLGKAVAVFDHGGILDPITLEFGRYYTSVRERYMRMRVALGDDEPSTRRTRLMEQLFGGEIRLERDREYVETADGRKIPFGVLSSGQQELLPLWFALTNFSAVGPISRNSPPPTRLIYIEEPEAHLFPTAQSRLMEYLASVVNAERRGRQMLLTTHSPYMLSKINVLLKAGSIGYSGTKRDQSRVADIVPRSAWLRAEATRAYAIIDGQVEPILSNGFIDAEYLDEISSDISRDLNKLLEIEYA